MLNGWAVLLAGGDGTRLQGLTRRISGDARPKQFCSLFGGKSLLRQTRERVDSLFSHERMMFLVTRNHAPYYRDNFLDTEESGVVVQPQNRGTGVAIALSLLRILEREEDPVVAFFPCDHYYANGDAFCRTIAEGMSHADNHPESIVLLGAEANAPETEYGWIEAGPEVSAGAGNPLFRVRCFWEKPSLPKARSLWRRGCLWNTFVTIGRARAFLELLRTQLPHVLDRLAGSDLDVAYQNLDSADFSRQVLTPMSDRLLVMRDSGSGWADLGDATRVIDTLVRNRVEAWWLRDATNVELA
jgi:mannose-1-phosphate guanylyltransferase